MHKTKPIKEQLNEEYITANADIVEWEYVSEDINIPDFSEEFFHKFKHDIYWYDMAWENKSMTTELAHKYEKEIGAKCWYKNGLLHRDNGPAIIYLNGTEYWFQNDKLHRIDGPAAICADGTECWYQNGKCHREDGPAIIYPDGYEICYKNGEQTCIKYSQNKKT